MKLGANIATNNPGPSAGAGLSVSPIGFSITENFEMHFDMWLNFNGPFPTGGSGSTLVGGGGFGTAGATTQTAGVADSVYVSATGDGGSVADYRIYTPAAQASVQDGNPAYIGAATRNNTQAYYSTNFPGQSATNNAPAQLLLFPQQNGITQNGAQGMKWRDVTIRKIANIITYKIDGIPIAVVDMSTNGTLGGANILFNYFDINGTVSVDPNFFDLNFGLFDNVRITNFPSIISVTATTTDIAEGNATPGVFNIFRNEPGPAVTVNYTMAGTALNGIDYTNAAGTGLSGSVTLANGALSTNISVFAVDDSISEFAETIILNVTESTNYVGAGTATINIADNDTPTIDVITVRPTMYERHTNDFIGYQLQRRGDLSPSIAAVNLTFSGTAASGTDFVPTNAIPVNGGSSTAEFSVSPLNNSSVSGPKTVTVTVAAGYWLCRRHQQPFSHRHDSGRRNRASNPPLFQRPHKCSRRCELEN